MDWVGGSVYSTNLSSVTDTTTGWTELTGDIIAPAGTTGGYLLFTSFSGGSGYTTYVDDVVVQKVSNVASPAVNVGVTNAEAVTIGNASQLGATTLQGGAGGVTINAGTNGSIDIGTTSNANNVTIGSTAGGVTTFQGNGISDAITGAGTNPSDVIQSTTNSTDAFQVQNSSGAGIFTVDTSNSAVVLGQDGTSNSTTVRGGAATGSNANGGNITFEASNGTGSAGSGSFVFQTAKPAAGGIAKDNSASEVGSGSTSTLSFTTGSESNRLLLVTAETVAGSMYTSITYDGDSLTQLATKTNDVHVEMWYLLNPPSGTYNIVGTMNTADGNLIGATTFYNVNQSNPFGTVASSSGTTTGNQIATLNVTTTSTSQVVVDGIGTDGADPTSQSGQTQLWNQSGSWPTAAAEQTGTDGTVSMNWAVNASDWADIGVPINAVTNTSADSMSDSLIITDSGNIGVDNSAPQYALDVDGVINSNTSIDVNGVAVCTTACAPSSGSGNYIQNSTTVQANSNLFIRGVGGSSPTAIVQGANGQTGSLLQLQTWNGTSSTTVDNFDSNGDLTIATSSTSAFQVQDGSSNTLLTINTNSESLTLGYGTQAGAITLGQSTVTNTINIGNGAISSGNTQTVNIGTGASGTGADAVSIGSTNGASSVAIGGGSGGVAINTSAGNTVAIGTSHNEAVTVGDTSTTNSLTFGQSNSGETTNVEAGSGANTVNIADVQNAGSVNIGAGMTTGTVAIGGTSQTGALTVKAEGISQTISGSLSAPSEILKTTTNSTNAFQIQNSGGVSLLTADTTSDMLLSVGTGTINFTTTGSGDVYVSGAVGVSGQLIVGTSTNGINTSSGQLRYSGSYQNTKTIILAPEYAGATLDATSDSSCSSANNGTMTSGYSGNSSPRQNYYNWTSSQSGSQCYDVVVQVPIPADFAGWSGTPTIYAYNSSGTNSTSVYIEPLDTTGTLDSNYSGYTAISTGTTFGSKSFPAALGGTYSANGYMTLKIRLSAANGTNVEIGNITLTYKSSF